MGRGLALDVANMSSAAKARARAEGYAASDADQAASEPPRVKVTRGLRCAALARRMFERSKEPWIELLIGGESIGRLRAGSFATVTGPPGSGKTTLVAAIATEHTGPVLFVSIELDGDELIGRIVGMHCDASWEDVLRGRVSTADVDRVLNIPGFIVLEGDDATVSQLEVEVDIARSEFPGQPVLVIVDYLQIVPSDEREVRARVAGVVQQLRRIAKKLGVVVIGISQPSRAAGKALSSGELVGGDTMTTGAESAEIERAAYMTFAIGTHGPDRDDGTRSVDLSVGKGRFGGGDRVIPMSYCGRSGKWRIAGEARASAEVKAERQSSKDHARTSAAALAMTTCAERSKEPVTREDLRAAAAVNRSVAKAAIAHLLESGDLVEVMKKKPRAAAWMLWTAAKAEKAGFSVVRGDE